MNFDLKSIVKFHIKEFLFVIYLLSGMIKTIFIYYHLILPIDFTLFLALLMSLSMMIEFLYKKCLIFTNWYLKQAFYMLVYLFIWILFSIFYSSSDHYIYEKISRYLTILVAFLYPISFKNFSIEKFYRLFVLSSIGLTIIYIPIFLSSYSLYITTHIANGVYMSYLSMGYIIALALLINFFKVKNFKYRLFTLIILLPSLIITGARGPLIFLILILIIYILYKIFVQRRIHYDIFKYLLVFSILFILILPFLDKINIENELDRTYTRLTALSNVSDDTSANSRLVFMKFVLDRQDIRHLFQGYGFGSFGIEYIKSDERYYPHNIFLEVLFELGLIGLVIYILFNIFIVLRLFIIKQPFESLLFLFLFLNSLKSLSIVDSRIMFGMFVLLLLSAPSNQYTEHHIEAIK